MKILFSLLCTLICLGCSYDYDMNDDIADFKPQVVVNSIINPNEPVKVELYWSRHYSEKGQFNTIANFHIMLYENGILVSKTDAKHSITFNDIYPKTGGKYNLKIEVPNYGEVTAETSIPELVSAEGYHRPINGNGRYRAYKHVRIDKLVPIEKTRAVWIKCYAEYENDTLIYARELYSNTPFADQVNAVLDATDATDKGSNVGFEQFMRIPYQNIAMIAPLDFSLMLRDDISEYVSVENDDDRPLDADGNPIYYYYHKMKWIGVDVIAPSEDYDRYFKTLYRQNMLDFEPDMPFVGEAVPVYSNIKNGLGIFAGYNVTTLKIIKNEE